MLLQVHDELVLECPRGELEVTARLVQETMANAYPMSIPLSTEAAASGRIKQVSIARLLGEAIRRIHHSDSVSSLFV